MCIPRTSEILITCLNLPGLKWGKEWTPGHVSSFGVPSTCQQRKKMTPLILALPIVGSYIEPFFHRSQCTLQYKLLLSLIKEEKS